MDFPQLIFPRPKHQNKCEVVFSENVPTSTLLDSETDTSTIDSEATPQTISFNPYRQEQSQSVFAAGIIIHRVLEDGPDINILWPPLSTDLDIAACEEVVPMELYNLLAWIVGAFDEPSKEKLKLPTDTYLKVTFLVTRHHII